MILKVRPTIFSDDRIDLDVMQEVSAARTTSTGVNISPTFSQRKVETKLTLREGSTVMLAGLISSQDTRSESGVPLLKDIPVVGQLFKNDQRTSERTELVILITPYVISDDYRRPRGDRRLPHPARGLEWHVVPPLVLASPAPARAPGPLRFHRRRLPKAARVRRCSPTPAVPKPASEAPILDGDGAAKPSGSRHRRPVPSHRL